MNVAEKLLHTVGTYPGDGDRVLVEAGDVRDVVARIAALEAERDRLREALADIARCRICPICNMAARAALEASNG